MQDNDNDDIAVVTFRSQTLLDDEHGEDLFRLVDVQGRHRILLNFANVESITNAAMGKLITLMLKVQAVRGELVLCGLSNELTELFELTKLDRLFVIRDNEADALGAFTPSKPRGRPTAA